ncbi:MAG: hypothetical protein IJD92_00100 [Bacilli bacterium]|nr:hypothetical protein [Bacilli bacterium]
MSITRKRYFIRLIGRILIFIGCFIMSFKPNFYDILYGMNFFKGFHVLHLLWIIWIFDMILQIVPVKNKLALGSQKLFINHFKPIADKINYEAIKNYIKKTTVSAYKVFIIWFLLIGVIATLYYLNIINKVWLFMISVCFYVCDLICVLIWCPFRLIMKNKCCTTCRIFNWDHLMMFSPLIFCGGFFAISLVTMAFIAWLVWELCVLIYPERFSEISNVSLRCSSCTDKLCTQYCKKLR